MLADNDNELLMILDDNGKPTGELKTREFVHKNRLFHNETTIFVINKDRVLLERRSKNKRLFPLMLCAPGGHVLKNEDIKKSALNELKEEIGLIIKESELKFLTRYKRIGEKQNSYLSVFYVFVDKNISEFKKQDSEVEELIYMNIDEFLDKTKDEQSDVMYDYYAEKQLFDKLEKIVKGELL